MVSSPATCCKLVSLILKLFMEHPESAYLSQPAMPVITVMHARRQVKQIVASQRDGLCSTIVATPYDDEVQSDP